MRAAAASVSSMACFRTRAERVVLVAASFSADMPPGSGSRNARRDGGVPVLGRPSGGARG